MELWATTCIILDRLLLLAQQQPVRWVPPPLHRSTDLVAKHCQLLCCRLHFQLHLRPANKAGPFDDFHAHKFTHTVCSSLSRSQYQAAVAERMSDHSLSPLHGSASHWSSVARSAVQSSNGTYTPPYSRQYPNLPAYSPTSTASSSLNQHSTLTSPAPALGRSLPSSTLSPAVPATNFRLPIRPVGPPPSQQLLSPGGGRGDGTPFQSLVQV
jgi:hypothetical protein